MVTHYAHYGFVDLPFDLKGSEVLKVTSPACKSHPRPVTWINVGLKLLVDFHGFICFFQTTSALSGTQVPIHGGPPNRSDPAWGTLAPRTRRKKSPARVIRGENTGRMGSLARNKRRRDSFPGGKRSLSARFRGFRHLHHVGPLRLIAH